MSPVADYITEYQSLLIDQLSYYQMTISLKRSILINRKMAAINRFIVSLQSVNCKQP